MQVEYQGRGETEGQAVLLATIRGEFLQFVVRVEGKGECAVLLDDEQVMRLGWAMDTYRRYQKLGR